MIIKGYEASSYQNNVSVMYMEDEAGHKVRVIAKYDLVQNLPYEIKITFMKKKDDVVIGYYNVLYGTRKAEIKERTCKWMKKEVSEILNLLLESHYNM